MRASLGYARRRDGGAGGAGARGKDATCGVRRKRVARACENGSCRKRTHVDEAVVRDVNISNPEQARVAKQKGASKGTLLHA